MPIALTTTESLWFLPLVAPICIYVAWTDLSSMKIRNHATDALLAVFVVLGLFALPFDAYLWRLLHAAVALGAIIVLMPVAKFGGGDAKFCISAAPYMVLADWRIVLMLFCGFLLASFFVHRLARATPLRRLAPNWQSWKTGQRFPMGLPLGATLITYLALPLIYG